MIEIKNIVKLFGDKKALDKIFPFLSVRVRFSVL